MKKFILFLYFFLTPVLIYLVWKTNWFNEIVMDIFYFLIVLFIITLLKRPKWPIVLSLLGILLFLSGLKGIPATIEDHNYFRWYLAGGILIIALCMIWLYNQYQKPGKKNPVEEIFGFQVGFVFFAWIFSYLVLPTSWMVWTMIAGGILGGIGACYNYCESNKKEIYD